MLAGKNRIRGRVVLSVFLLVLSTQLVGFVHASLTSESSSGMATFVSGNGSQLSIGIGSLDAVLEPSVDTSLGQFLSLDLQDDAKKTVAVWHFDNGLLQTTITGTRHGVFLNVTMQIADSCSCKTDVMFRLFSSGFSAGLESVILSTTPVSSIAPPSQKQVLIEALDYASLRRLYGVASALVLSAGSTFEIVSLYPFASLSYDPQSQSALLLFRKGRGDLSTCEFESGDSEEVFFYLGSANARENKENAFGVFAEDVEETFPTRDSGKPFMVYGADGGSWNDVRREAESLGYTVVYSARDRELTNANGGGHYFGLSWEKLDRLNKAGLESALIRGRDGGTIGDGVCVRVNPSVTEFQVYLQRQIDALLPKRQWFFADGASVIQDFDLEHTNALVGQIQVLLHVRSTGRALVYNPFHSPHLWLDWIADGALIEAPTGLFRFSGGPRVDYLEGTGGIYAATRDSVRVRSMFFPHRATIWHDYVNLEDDSISDSIALFLMSGANSYSFSTNPSGWVNVKPGEITRVVEMLAKADSIRRLDLGQITARGFRYSEDERSWRFQALSAGVAVWLGRVDQLYLNNAPTDVSYDGTSSAFVVADPSDVTLVYSGN